ncbi:MAG: DEAD/DEAH box helicase [Anaerolineae bacterium]|nr:DEAD/DEAH box helicase [Anaerolineae bacterium]
MPRWLDRLLGRPEIQSLPVVFELEENPAGRHEVRVYQIIDGVAEPVRDPDALLAGTGEAREVGGRRVRHTLSLQDAQTLAALRSMAPEASPDGTWVLDLLPVQLTYLRQRANVHEGPRSRSLTISDIAERPSMSVRRATESGSPGGLDVTFGFADEQGRIVAPDRVVRTSGGDYARVGRRYLRLPSALGRRDRALLEGGTVMLPPERIPGFFLRDLVVLGSGFDAVLVGEAADIQVLDADAIKPVIKLDAGVSGWLDFSVSYDVDGKPLPVDLLRRGGGADGCVQVDDRTWVRVDPGRLDAVETRLERLPATRENGRYRVPAHQFATIQEFVADIGGRQVASEAYRGFLSELTGFRADPGFRLGPEAEAHLADEGIALRPYQREGIQWMDWLGRHQLHGLLADDMGLGKTLQAIAALRLAYERETNEDSSEPVDRGLGETDPVREPSGPGHSLVIAPRSVLSHWEREIGRCFPEIRICRYHGPGRDATLLASPEPTVFITTYSTAANDIGALVQVPFFYVILDEATYIKNPGARRTRAIKRINGAHRLALSGTPVENRPAELWSVFDYLMPGHLGRYGTFTRTFESDILSGDLAVSGRLGQRVRPFMLRRLKADVAKDLPPKVPIRESCELTAEQRQLYGGLQDAIKQARVTLEGGGSVNFAMSILPVLLRLKQICDHPALVSGEQLRAAGGTVAVPVEDRRGHWTQPWGSGRRTKAAPSHGILGRSEKFDWIIAKADEIVGRGEQVVIFSHFLGMLDLLGTALADRGISTIRIDGSTRDRQAEIDRFTNDGVPVALCSLKATSMGINLQTANHVIHADRWWNPAAEDQATDRVHRIGQDRTVYVYYIVTEGTLEERIDALLDRKRGIAGQILDDTAQGLQGWTREELLEVLKPLEA